MHNGKTRGRIKMQLQRPADPPEPLDLDAGEIPLPVVERRCHLRHARSDAVFDQIEHLLPLRVPLTAGCSESLAHSAMKVRPAHHLIECHSRAPSAQGQ